MTVLPFTVLALAIGVSLWLVLLIQRKSGKLNANRLLLTVFFMGLLCRLAFVFGTPTFYAPDEQSHYNYIRYVSEHASLPVQTSQTGAATNDWEYYQPPLYYVALAPVYAASAALFHDTRSVVRMLRLMSVLLWIATAWFAMRFLEVLEIKDRLLSIVVFCVVCLLPTYTFLSSAINNDNLLLALSAIFLYFMARPNFTDSPGVITGLLLGLAVLTKLTGVVLCAAYALMLLIEAIRQPDRRRIVLRHFMVAGSIAALLVLPWVIRNVLIYHSVTAEYVANVPREWPSYLFALYHVLKGIVFTFWSVSGIHNNVKSLFPAVGGLLTISAGLGFILSIRSAGRIKQVIPYARQRWFLIAMGIAFVVNAILVLRFGLLYAQGQGRFLYPLLLPEALFLGLGLRYYRLQNLDIHAAGLFFTYSIGFTLFSLIAFHT